MLLAGFLVFLTLFSLGAYFVMSYGQPHFERQLAGRLGRPEVAGEEILRDTLKPERGAGSRWGWFYQISIMHKLEQSLWQAGIYRRVSDVLLVMLMLFGAGAMIGAGMCQDPTLALGFGGLLAVLPVFYIRLKRNRRLKRFVQQLPFALDLMKS
ncbi:MAG TPA: hypothetical protein VKR29_05905, partial [Candidatus Binataceae bacterium]|nr:hypothetical protein [Candidatus Binataceae bacterium]